MARHKRPLPPNRCTQCQKRTWLDKCFDCGAPAVRAKKKEGN